jgi:hypothetical protein
VLDLPYLRGTFSVLQTLALVPRFVFRSLLNHQNLVLCSAVIDQDGWSQHWDGFKCSNLKILTQFSMFFAVSEISVDSLNIGRNVRLRSSSSWDLVAWSGLRDPLFSYSRTGRITFSYKMLKTLTGR